MQDNARKPSYRLVFEDAVKIWMRFWDGEYQNRIAADYDVNPGRVNDVVKGRRFKDSKAVAQVKYRK